MAKLITKTTYRDAAKSTEGAITTVAINAMFEIENGFKSVALDVVIDAAQTEAESISQFEERASSLVAVYEGLL